MDRRAVNPFHCASVVTLSAGGGMPGLCGEHKKQSDPHPMGMGSDCAWWTIKGSNLGPSGYEPVALTN